jgi:hypothetical protein
MLQRHEAHAAIIVAASAAPAVQRLLSDGSMHLASLDHVEGLARRFGYFQPVSLKRGSVDPQRDLPNRDIALLATTANLVVRDELHPALAYLLLEAAREVHQGPSLIHKAGEFPAERDRLPFGVERYFKDGRQVPALPLDGEPRAASRACWFRGGHLIPLVRLLPGHCRRQKAACITATAELGVPRRTWQLALSMTTNGNARQQLDRIENGWSGEFRLVFRTGSTRCASTSTMCGASWIGRRTSRTGRSASPTIRSRGR